MTDVFTVAKRSSVMSAIRSKGNRDTEICVRNIFRKHRVSGWRRQFPLAGKPDFAFPRHRLALFIDGCFWHGCPRHGRTPGSNQEYWISKLARNRQRDLEVVKELRKSGWKVLRIWEHDLRHPEALIRRVQRHLGTNKSKHTL
ncbi:MAG: mismatch repair protein Vsr [Verrucomicrobiales bacterium]|nr:mismatch repair protein Vsr [Verrucomicrobiales bacterium]